MGIQYMSDPDNSYVLTIDNMKKMLAIQMRFRYKCLLLCLLVKPGVHWLKAGAQVLIIFSKPT